VRRIVKIPSIRIQVIVMAQTRRPLFRESALKHYMQKREKDVLPRLISQPIFVGLWVLLFVFMGVGVLASFAEVPVFANGPGVIIAGTSGQQTQQAQATQNGVSGLGNAQNAAGVGRTAREADVSAGGATATATPTPSGNAASSQQVLVVLSALFRSQLHVGQEAWVQPGTKGPLYRGHLVAVDSTVIGPGSIQPQYATSGIAPLLTQPSVVVTVKLDKPMPRTSTNLVQARVQIGSRRVGALLMPGMKL
jgi:hypothetical protein